MKIVNRIKDSKDFASTIKIGKVFRSNSYTIHVAENHLSHTRVGISVSTKVGNAVTRNRVKRQLRAMCDSLIDYSKNALDIVVIVRKPYLNQDFTNNKSQLCELLNKQTGVN